MSSILVYDLSPVGLELVSDQEGYFSDLEENGFELNHIQGGATVVYTVVVTTILTAAAASAYASYAWGRYTCR